MMQYKTNRNLILSIIGLIAAGCSSRNDAIIGTKIYDYRGSYTELFAAWQRGGINTAFVSLKLASDNEFRELAREHRVKVFVIFPVFFNPDTLHTNPSLFAISNKGGHGKQDWVEFVCPSRECYRSHVHAELERIIRTLNPDGVSIDFIRHFLYWEMVRPETPVDSILHGCYCDSCISRFAKATRVTVPDTFTSAYRKAQWLRANDGWASFKSMQVTSMVRSLAGLARTINPDVKVNLHAVPWREGDYSNARYYLAGQDIKELAKYVDYISPMCYSWMLYREPEWVASVVQDFDRFAPGKVLPSIEVNSCYREGILSPEEFRLNLVNALKSPSKGVVFWEWSHFEADSTKIKVLLNHSN